MLCEPTGPDLKKDFVKEDIVADPLSICSSMRRARAKNKSTLTWRDLSGIQLY